MDALIKASHSITKHPEKQNFRLHIHDHCEIFRFLHGDADYFVEGSIYPLRKGDIIIARQSEAHHLILRSPAEYERNVISFPISLVAPLDGDGKIADMFSGRPIGKYNHFPSRMFPERMWEYFINKICEADTQERKLIYLYGLLAEMTDEFRVVKALPENAGNNKTADIIQYIDSHLFENISMDIISKRFFISQAHLNRLFKAAAGTTVWNYITAKRLIHAKALLENGERPTKVYEQCGYMNYVSFYKAYKNYYGAAPSDLC